jgi:hypothetical protein
MTSAKELRKIAKENKKRFEKLQREKEEKEAPAEVEKIIKLCAEASYKGYFDLFINADSPIIHITNTIIKILRNKGYTIWDKTRNTLVPCWVIKW